MVQHLFGLVICWFITSSASLRQSGPITQQHPQLTITPPSTHPMHTTTYFRVDDWAHQTARRQPTTQSTPLLTLPVDAAPVSTIDRLAGSDWLISSSKRNTGWVVGSTRAFGILNRRRPLRRQELGYGSAKIRPQRYIDTTHLC